MPPDFRPVAVVTGATSGIGQASSRALAAAGFRVFGSGRNPDRDADQGVELLSLEVTSDDSVKAFADEVNRRADGRVDFLLSNVGTGILGASEEASSAEVERLFRINFFGGVRVVNAFLPLMRARKSGTVAVMSSAGGVAAVPFASYYCATKFALEGYAEGLRQELRPLNIAVSVIAPGAVSTPAGEKAILPDRKIADYSPRKDELIAKYVEGIRKGMAVEKVAAVVVEVAKAKWPKPRYRVGGQSKAVSVMRSLLPTSVFEAGVRGALG